MPTSQDLDQSLATLQLAKDIIRNSRRRDFWLILIVIVSLLVNVFIALIFVGYESQFTTTETITTTVEQDTGEGGGNNIYQAGEQASYIQGDFWEGYIDGQAKGDSDQNENQNSQEQP